MQTTTGRPQVAALQPSNQRAVQQIARDIACRPVGDRLETTLHYQQALGVGAGTVQKALRLIESIGAARLRPAGHQGTFVEAHHLGLLWNLAGLGPVRFAFTPPGAVEHHGLAAGLTDELARLEVQAGQRYVRGAERRRALLEAGETEVAVVSRGAAQRLFHGDRWRLFDLGTHTYYSEQSLLVVSKPAGGKAGKAGTARAAAGGLRVAIDRSSSDHEQLTLAEFPPDGGHQYVGCDFPHVPTAILEGRVDVGVWHELLLLVPLALMGLATRPLERPEARRMHAKISSAVLVYRADDAPVAAVLREIDLDAVRARQRAFIAAGPDSEEIQSVIWAR